MDISIITAFHEYLPMGIALNALTYTTAAYVISVTVRRMWHNHEKHVEQTITAVVGREMNKEYTGMMHKLRNQPEPRATESVGCPYMSVPGTDTRKHSSVFAVDQATPTVNHEGDGSSWSVPCRSFTWVVPGDNIPPTPMMTTHRPSVLQFDNRVPSTGARRGTVCKREDAKRTMARTIVNLVECRRRMLLSDIEKETIVNHCHHTLRARVWFPGFAVRERIQPWLLGAPTPQSHATNMR